MSIPDRYELMLPLLELAGDGAEHSMQEAVDRLAERFGLTDEERNMLYPSGKNLPIFPNILGWARTYLKKAGLLEYTRPAHFKITERGLALLAERPDRIDAKYLRRYPEFVAFGSREEKTPRSGKKPPRPTPDAGDTPLEVIDKHYQQLKLSLADELLSAIKQQSPAFFERLVVDLLVKMGYGGSIKDAGRAIGRSGDEGVDGIIKEDKLGLDVVYIQAKRWDGPVGRPAIQSFVGAMHGRASKGVFITTSTFTKDAVEYAKSVAGSTKIVLIDGEELAQRMIEHNVGVVLEATYEIKRIDSGYFEGG